VANPFETSGGADAFLGFLEQEVVPFVEQRYRTAPLRILGGHSFGGLFALHALTERPGLFRAYVAASPTLTWDGELPLKRVQALLERRPDLAATVYYTVGDEGAALADAFRRFGEIVAKGGPRFRATGVHHAGEDHGSIVLDTFHRGFRALFEGWRMPVEAGAIGPKGGLAAVEAHYRAISDRLGIVVAPPENTLNLAGYQALQDGRPGDAIATLRRCVEIYGTSPNAHDSLGEAYEKKGELALALASYERAAELGAKRGDPLTATFRANLERAKRLVRDAKR
ncbi:MAG TPA: alpha/beta hydrolase-fold protein, partial [Anaeromyxobacteraceae bacterium]|nr:alpha/beta hydrolase-fold protein [Anaeromyxobacteraceae bacterium]